MMLSKVSLVTKFHKKRAQHLLITDHNGRLFEIESLFDNFFNKGAECSCARIEADEHGLSAADVTLGIGLFWLHLVQQSLARGESIQVRLSPN
jgi:hypothetical protein